MKKRLDFLAAYNRKPAMPSFKKVLLGAIAVVVLLAAAFGVYVITANSRLKNLEALCAAEESYINNPATQSRLDEYDAISDEYDRELSLASELEKTLSAINSYPNINSALFRAVNSAAGKDTTLYSYSYTDETGILTLTGGSRDFYEGANYARRLEGLDRFIEVGYHGYYLEDRTYAFEDNCLMKPGNSPISIKQR